MFTPSRLFEFHSNLNLLIISSKKSETGFLTVFLCRNCVYLFICDLDLCFLFNFFFIMIRTSRRRPFPNSFCDWLKNLKEQFAVILLDETWVENQRFH